MQTAHTRSRITFRTENFNGYVFEHDGFQPVHFRLFCAQRRHAAKNTTTSGSSNSQRGEIFVHHPDTGAVGECPLEAALPLFASFSFFFFAFSANFRAWHLARSLGSGFSASSAAFAAPGPASADETPAADLSGQRTLKTSSSPLEFAEADAEADGAADAEADGAADATASAAS